MPPRILRLYDDRLNASEDHGMAIGTRAVHGRERTGAATLTELADHFRDWG